MQQIIGFAGRAGTGKSTAAALFNEIMRPQQSTHIEFSEPIVTIAQAWLESIGPHATHRMAIKGLRHALRGVPKGALPDLINSGLRSSLLKSYFRDKSAYAMPIGEATKVQHRLLLEWLGKSVVDCVDPAFWSNIVQTKAKTAIERGADLITISGIRSRSDALAVWELGGSIMRLTRTTAHQSLPSEESVTDWQPDFLVENNGTLADLYRSVENILTQLPKQNAIHITPGLFTKVPAN